MGLITEDRAPEAARERSGAGGLGRSRLAGDDEQEITLGTRSLLGVFFGLVLVCGIFFGLGYSVGRSGGTHLASPDVPGSNAAANADLKKPSAEQSLTPVPEPGADTSPTPSGSSSAGSGDENAAGSSAAPAAAPVAAEPAAKAVAVPVAQPVARPAAAQAAPLAIARPAPPVQRPADLHQQPSVAAVQSAPAAAPSTFMVQIAAVRLPQDANVLVGALQRRGYHVVVRNEPQDALLHVQLGPFGSRAEANDMRARLLADGYNAVVK
jgi:cell division septation protein DedD